MVQLMSRSSSSQGKRSAAMVKVEVEEEEEYLEDQFPHLNKRPKLDTSPTFLRSESDLSDVLEEPSPLGLRLKKSPSLLELIQMKLSQEKTTPLSSMISKKVHKERGGSAGTSVAVTDKLKASNFPASLLKIGTWQYKSRYEGDLVAKCYFAKHKLVWEVLDGGLKNKIEIQWSDIVAIKANFPEDEPEALDVVLARQPLFFRETNPQPRKHTLWQATSDFTGGQASIHKRHFLQCHQGFLGKHFEKLTQCDPRLNILSQQPEIVLESPYFDPKFSAFGNLNESHERPDVKDKEITSGFVLRDEALGSGVLSSSLNNECHRFKVEPPEVIPKGSPTPDKGEEIGPVETKMQDVQSHWEKIRMPGVQQSVAGSELVKNVKHFITNPLTADQPSISNNEQTQSNISEEVAEYLLGDSEVITTSDEQSLMLRVNSLCCLLQKDHETQSLLAKDCKDLVLELGSTGETNSKNGSGCEKGSVISRKDSVGDLLLELPRIASLPQFLCNM